MPKPRKRKRRLTQQLKTLFSVRRPLPPARVVHPDPKRTAARRRVKRVDPDTQ